MGKRFEQRVQAIERCCARDPGLRGITAMTKTVAGDLWGAACALRRHAEDAEVWIVSGFLVGHTATPAVETDGIWGAVWLAAGLDAIGVTTRLVTDKPCAEALALAVTIVAELHSWSRRARPAVIVPLPPDTDAASEDGGEHWLWDALPDSRPSHLIAIERAGQGADGQIRDMRGQVIDSWTAPFDPLFRDLDCTRIAIGDGGNEIGMGRIPSHLIHESITHGATIACTTSCDHLLVCGVSHWGSWGLLAALAVLEAKWYEALCRVLTDSGTAALFERWVQEAPAIDGVTRVFSTSIDGLSWTHHQDVLAEIMAFIAQSQPQS